MTAGGPRPGEPPPPGAGSPSEPSAAASSDADPAAMQPQIEPPSGRARRWRALVGGIIGLALVIAAIAAVATRHEEMGEAWEALRTAPWWMVALAVALPLANWVLVSLALWVITARYGPVRPGEMMGLVAGAWLLNYLPMRPGMFGRIAYHRKINRIPVKTSMGLLVISMGLTAAAIAILTVLGLALRWAGGLAAEITVVAGAGLVIAVAAACFRATRGPWRIATALLLRYLDMLVWVARYWIVFRLVGQDLSFEQACAIAAVSQAATAIPLSGNGLGLREWAVGLSAAALPAWFGGATVAAADPDSAPAATILAVAADLVNRGVEMAIALPIGLLGLAWVARRLRAHARANPPPAHSPDATSSPAPSPTP